MNKELISFIEKEEKAFIPGHGYLAAWTTEDHAIIVRLPLEAELDNLEFNSEGQQLLTDDSNGPVTRFRSIFINIQDMIDYHVKYTEKDFDNFRLIPFWSYVVFPQEKTDTKYRYLGVDKNDVTMKPRMVFQDTKTKEVVYRIKDECKYQVVSGKVETSNKEF